MRQTKAVQQWCEDHPDSEIVDTKYGIFLSLRWTDEDTCRMVLAAEMYRRYKSQFRALSLDKLLLYVGNYLNIMIQIKILASVQSDCIPGKKGKRIRAPPAKQGSSLLFQREQRASPAAEALKVMVLHRKETRSRGKK
jgi:hypothetical protein